MEAGKKLGGRYKIVRHIGSGGMANVYLGHDLILDRPVAIKVLRFDFRNNTDALRRFQREALSATQLIHPNIVGVYDVDEEDELQYIVMEFIDGTDLKKYIDIQGRVLPEKRSISCTKFCRLWRWHIKIGLFTGTSSHKIF